MEVERCLTGAVCVQTFIKTVNYQHLMPTRYTLEADLKGVVTAEAQENPTKKKESRKVMVPPCMERHGVGGVDCTEEVLGSRCYEEEGGGGVCEVTAKAQEYLTKEESRQVIACFCSGEVSNGSYRRQGEIGEQV